MNKKKFYFFNKLVRDKAHEMFNADGSVISTRILKDDTEFKGALYKKILEEVEELFTAETRSDIIEEYADVQEVLQAIQRLYNISQEEVDTAQQRKQGKRGAYDKRLFLSAVCCNEESQSDRCALKNGYSQITQEEYRAYCAADKEYQREQE